MGTSFPHRRGAAYRVPSPTEYRAEVLQSRSAFKVLGIRYGWVGSQSASAENHSRPVAVKRVEPNLQPYLTSANLKQAAWLLTPYPAIAQRRSDQSREPAVDPTSAPASHAFHLLLNAPRFNNDESRRLLGTPQPLPLSCTRHHHLTATLATSTTFCLGNTVLPCLNNPPPVR